MLKSALMEKQEIIDAAEALYSLIEDAEFEKDELGYNLEKLSRDIANNILEKSGVLLPPNHCLLCEKSLKR